jgi:hypothetical protein
MCFPRRDSKHRRSRGHVRASRATTPAPSARPNTADRMAKNGQAGPGATVAGGAGGGGPRARGVS